MKHLSFKVEVFLVTGAWLIASGLEIASYLATTTPTEKFLSLLILVLFLISTGWYVWNTIQISRLQKTQREVQEQIEIRNKQLELYEQIQEKIDEVQKIILRAQS